MSQRSNFFVRTLFESVLNFRHNLETVFMEFGDDSEKGFLVVTSHVEEVVFIDEGTHGESVERILEKRNTFVKVMNRVECASTLFRYGYRHK